MTAAVLDKLAEQHPDDNTIVGHCQEGRDRSDRVRPEARIWSRSRQAARDHRHAGVQARAGDRLLRFAGAAGEKRQDILRRASRRLKTGSSERKESFFREYNNYMLRDLTVHEAMPGHYLQLAHSNEFHAPTLVRAIFQSGTFIEGWAVYTEQLMAEAGYGGPEVKMQQLKMRLRVICNAILDQSIHAANMSEQEALDLMMKEGFQQEGEAVAKWKRARLSSTQLSTYFIGVTEHLELRERAKAKAGASFDLKKYNDTRYVLRQPAGEVRSRTDGAVAV